MDYARTDRFSAYCATIAAIVVTLQVAPTTAIAATSVLVVPTQYATIQSAVDAARPGDRIRILAGTYIEQVSINKDLDITGAGVDSTVIRPPADLVSGAVFGGSTSIVEIYGGANVALSRLSVSGPGLKSCEDGSLGNGIAVFDGAHLELTLSAVRHIHDTPLANCFPGGLGIVVGDPFSTNATATIRQSEISVFAGVGIMFFNEVSSAVILNYVITGPGLSPIVATGGVEMIFGAGAIISHNTISGNACGSAALGCGPDFFNEFQVGGISGGGPGTVISNNVLHGNQVGIYVVDTAEISQNVIVDNHYFGMALQDGSFKVSHDEISGGYGAIAVIAAFADAQVLIDHERIGATSGAPVQTFQCCGFTATVAGGP
jgi:hypothetical protein